MGHIELYGYFTVLFQIFQLFFLIFSPKKQFFQEMRSSHDGSGALVQGKAKEESRLTLLFVLALPILPVRLQTSIVGRNELNFRVRDGNGWTLVLINTNYLLIS